MSDIAERLKSAIQEFKTAGSTGGKNGYAILVNGIVMDNLDTIISALQFAEDMQRLADHGGSIVCNHGRNMWSVRLHGGKLHYGPDIFTAARNAVVQMEGK